MSAKCKFILLLFFVILRLSLCLNKSVDEKLRRESLINATFKLDASDTISPFEITTNARRTTQTSAETTAAFKTDTTFNINSQTLTVNSGDSETTKIGRNEFEKASTTFVPAYFTKKTDKMDTTRIADGSTPLVAAVYEEIPEEDSSGKPNTEASLFTNAGTGPIYVTMAESHHEICDFCIYEGEGNFTSYGYPLEYRPGLNCSYRIQRVDNDVCELEMYFHDFDVPVSNGKTGTKGVDGSNCYEDYLEVYGRRFCGKEWKGKSEVVPFPETEKEVTFYFRSNDAIAGRGFWLEVRRKPGTCYGKKPVHVCEERYSDPEFYITSPRFPNEYPANSECTYYIRKNADNVCGLEFTFLHFDVEAVNGCFYDHLEIDGQKYCGILQPNTVKTLPFTEDQKVVTFHSDKQGSKTGFQVRVKQIFECRVPNKLPPPPSCNICTSDRTGILVSYNYPNNYRNNLLCMYTIDKKDNNYCKIEAIFDEFDVLPSAECSEDYLQVNGKRFCGASLYSTKQVIEFDGNNPINLVFKTNEIGNSKGFSMKYTQIRCNGPTKGQEPVKPKKEPTEEPMERQMCDYTFNEKSFYLQSENVSNMYPNNLNCNYLIKKNTSAVCYLEFTFLKFDVEASPQCQFDYFEVNNVRLCGSLQKETTRTYIFEEKEKVMKFHSDASTNREGFVIKVDQLECQGDAIIRSSTTSATTAVTNLPYFPSVPSLPSCDQTYVGHEFEITSPHYPNSYPLNTDCMFIIQKLNQNICRLEVTYYDFIIQSPDTNSYCKFDYLDFNGIRMCGEVQKGSVRSYYFPENTFNVRFHSDGLYTAKDKGFRIGVRQGECGNSVNGPDTSRETDHFKCDQIFTKTTFEIKSPNYPETYPTNINCRYTIVKKTNGVPVCQLEVHFSDVQIEDDVDCQSDYIDFEGTRFCGPQPPKLIKFFPFDRSEFTIKFRSDGTDRGSNKKGFFVQIRQRECPDGFSVSTSIAMPTSPIPSMPPRQDIEKKTDHCSQTFTEKYFEIISPKYPAMYENNLDCFYMIKRNNPRICRVDLFFVDFDVEEDRDCERDFLSIDGMKICGQLKPNTMRSLTFTGNEKLVVFHSDTARMKGGFYIKGEQKECDTIPLSTDDLPPYPGAPSICEICYAETAGVIKSYGYPNNYPNNLNCLYKITGFPDYCSVYIKFDEFSLEPPKNGHCINDYVEIAGIRYCGNQLQGQKKIVTFTGSPKEVSLKFSSNGNANGRGFRGSYTQFPCTDMDTKQITLSSHPLPGVVTAGAGPISVVQNEGKHPHLQGGHRVPCDLVIFDKNFEIKSPGYPYSYPPNSDCLYSIRRINPEVCKLRLNIVDFDTDSTPDCRNDYLEFENQRLCGSLNHTTKEYPFSDYKFTLRFRCDGLRNRKGFLIRGQQMDCKPQSYAPVPPAQSPSEFAPSYPQYPIDQRMLDIRDPSSRFSHQIPYDTPVAPYVSGHYAPQPPAAAIPRTPYESGQANRPPPYIHGQTHTLPQPNYESGQSNAPSSHLRPGFYGFPRFNGDALPPVPAHKPQAAPLPVSGSPQIPNSYRNSNISSGSLPLNPSSSPSFPSGYGPQSVSCNRIIADAFFDIKSPQFPFRYKDGTKCMFVIKKFKENVCQLDLMFITFEVGDATCQRDFLSIEGERLCGLIPKEKVKTFKFDAHEKYIFFKGEIGGGLGFHIRGRQVECVDPNLELNSKNLHPQSQQPVIARTIPDQRPSPLPYCDQTFTAISMVVSSPGYPNNYPNNLYCRFTITRPTSSVCALDMKFLNFDVEDDPKCTKDYLEIDNGKICGNLAPNHERRYYYFPEEQKKTLIFRSDALTSKSGFSIEVKQITDCSVHSWKPESPAPAVCDVCSSEVRGHFTSNNYPKSYDKYVRCTYRISPHNEHYCKLRLHIRDLDIEESPACDKDYLYINNERICNTNYRPKETTLYFPQFGTKEIQFSFHTDGRNTGRGFYVEFLQDLCATSSIKPGNGHQYPSASTNGQTNESRQPDYAYEDHRGRSHASPSPQYPPNYVSKAHIEEIVETKVKVLDARSDPPPTIEYHNPDDVKPVTINVQKAAKRTGFHNTTSTFIEAH